MKMSIGSCLPVLMMTGLILICFFKTEGVVLMNNILGIILNIIMLIGNFPPSGDNPLMSL